MVFGLDFSGEMCYCIVTKTKQKGKVISMTMKTKRGLAICGGTALCAALALLIAMRFAPDGEQQLTPSIPETASSPTVNADISASNKGNPENTESSDSGTEATLQPEIDFDDFIENGGIEINQDFTDPKSNTGQSTPPDPPKIEDGAMLTNPNTEPTYTPEQLRPNTQTTSEPNSGSPKHGDTKNGMIYINGFGWVKDEGGGGRGETASDMYENGNKIGSFG